MWQEAEQGRLRDRSGEDSTRCEGPSADPLCCCEAPESEEEVGAFQWPGDATFPPSFSNSHVLLSSRNLYPEMVVVVLVVKMLLL